MSTLLAVLLLVACSDADSDRRFANEPIPTPAPATLTATIDPNAAPTATAGPTATDTPSLVALGPLLDARGAPKRLYFPVAGELWTSDAQGGDARRLYQPRTGEQIAAFAPAPGVAAGEVALLLAGPAPATATPAPDAGATPPAATPTPPGTTLSLVILSQEGAATQRIDGIEQVFGGPALDLGVATIALSWAPQGDLLLATVAPGGIVALPRGGVPSLLLPSAELTPAAAWWSPDGSAIAFIAADTTSGRRQLYVSTVAADGSLGTPAAIAPQPERGGNIDSAAWLPDGSGLLYAGSPGDGVASGGDLYRVSRDGSSHTLIASTGRAAPVARIAEFAISPDGRAVAYTVVIPAGAENPIFHSLWVQEIAGGEPVRIPISPGQMASQLRWVDGGLTWRTAPDLATPPPSEPSFTVERLTASGSVEVLFTHTASPEATPVASPVATPVTGETTPVASPVAATPVASPDAGASPAAATPLSTPLP